MAVLSKVLTKTDVEKRLSVRTVNKKCFLDFGNKHKVEFKVEDKNGDVWPFVCSTREGQDYPKPVLSKGWLRFVRRWKLAIGDRVVLHEIQGKAGTGLYRIEVIKRAKQSPGVLSPSILNHDGDRSMGNIGKEPTGTTHSTDQAMAYNQTDGLRDQTVSTVTSHSTDQAMACKQTEGLRDQPVSAVTFHSTDQPMAYNQTERLNDLPVTDRSLRSFPPLSDEHMVDFAVRDEESGRVWKFRIYTRKKKNNSKYLKPVLIKGWREFVCSKQLRVGDRVAFYSAEEQAGAVKYRVKVERPLKIFGALVFPS
ncbi:B3 DNA binding domain - like 10 [Theobroma cacao]|nr:B3 DNA binding domain - like 10 [Theobroma cacao]